jgi:hypothetical protein
MLGKTHHANVMFNRRQNSRVPGMVFEVTAPELAAADEYERSAACVRIAVMLASSERAWVYVDARSAPEHLASR